MTWLLIRTTGLVAYAFLSAAAIWGLLVSTGILGRGTSPKNLTYMHESLSVAAILATIGHIVLIYFDEFIGFALGDLFIPGRAAWRPTAVSLGIVAFYGLSVITASFYVRPKIGQRRWRLLHFASFGVYLSALVHGIAAGTDSGTVLGVVLYSSTATAIAFLTAVRGRLVARPAQNRSNRTDGKANPTADARRATRDTPPAADPFATSQPSNGQLR